MLDASWHIRMAVRWQPQRTAGTWPSMETHPHAQRMDAWHCFPGAGISATINSSTHGPMLTRVICHLSFPQVIYALPHIPPIRPRTGHALPSPDLNLTFLVHGLYWAHT